MTKKKVLDRLRDEEGAYLIAEGLELACAGTSVVLALVVVACAFIALIYVVDGAMTLLVDILKALEGL